MKTAWMILFASIIGLSGCTVVPLLVSNLNPSRFRADAETRSLCEKDGGIHVYRKVHLEVGRFPTVIPEHENPKSWIRDGVIYGKYRYQDTYTSQYLYGYNLYRYRTVISSISDNSVIGEMIYYLRQGEPGAPGIICPEKLSNEQLIFSVFSQNSQTSHSYPFCSQTATERTRLSVPPDGYFAKEKGPHVSARLPDSNIVWQRGINCDEQTQIDAWYDKTGKTSIGLVATRLLFFGADGKLCQSMATPDSEKIYCDSNGVSVVGFKRNPGSATLLLQRFSTNGELVAETEIEGVAPRPGKLASYRESENSIEIRTSVFSYPNQSQCFVATVPKPQPQPPSPGGRIGPPDLDFGYPACQTQ